MRYKMKKCLFFCVLTSMFLVSCGEYAYLQKTDDYEYKYELAKSYYAAGKYGRSSELFGNLLAVLKGTVYGEDCLFLLGMSTIENKDYESASNYFRKYYQSYPKGKYTELARYYSAYALYLQTPDIRLDQTSTHEAINSFQIFLDLYPNTSIKEQAQDIVYLLQEKLVQKEYLSAKLYFDLGSYRINSYGGSNYEACIVTAQNALRDYPFAKPEIREDLSFLILRSKYELACHSVLDKREARFRDAIDEYYAFVNDYPESVRLSDARKMFDNAEHIVQKKKLDISEKE